MQNPISTELSKIVSFVLLATEAMPQKSGLTLFVGVTFLNFAAGLWGLRAVVARGARVSCGPVKNE